MPPKVALLRACLFYTFPCRTSFVHRHVRQIISFAYVCFKVLTSACLDETFENVSLPEKEAVSSFL